jgi:thioredoxin 2
MSHTFTPDERGMVRNCPQCGQLNRLTFERLGHVFRCVACKGELSPPAEPVEAPTVAVFDSLIARSALPVLVDFWAPWCGPCKMVAPELAKAALTGSDRWLVVKVNTESLPDLGRRFRINSIPTMALFRGGREIARQSGAMAAPAIVQFVQSAASPS